MPAKNIPALHPYNIGWAALLFIIMPDGAGLAKIANGYKGFENKAVHFFLNKTGSGSKQRKWVEQVLTEYDSEDKQQSPPQLATGSWLLVGLCATVLYRLAINKVVKQFLDFYFLSTV